MLNTKIHDIGATNLMINDKTPFANLDENFSSIIHNDNKRHSSILGKVDVEFFTKDSEIFPKHVLNVPDNSKNFCFKTSRGWF